MATVFKRSEERNKKGSKWIISWYDAKNKSWRHTTGYTDKELSLEKGRRLEDEAGRRAEGLANSFDEHRTKPITKHLDDFILSVAARNRDDLYLSQLKNRITRIVKGTVVTKIHELDPV